MPWPIDQFFGAAAAPVTDAPARSSTPTRRWPGGRSRGSLRGSLWGSWPITGGRIPQILVHYHIVIVHVRPDHVGRLGRGPILGTPGERPGGDDDACRDCD